MEGSARLHGSDQQQQEACSVFKLFQVKLTDMLTQDDLRNKLSQALIQATILHTGFKGTSEQLAHNVYTRIKYYPHFYETFVGVLEECDNAYFGLLINEMKQAYPGCFQSQCAPAPPMTLPSRTPQRGRTSHVGYLDLSTYATVEGSQGEVSGVAQQVHYHNYHIHQPGQYHEGSATLTAMDFVDSDKRRTYPVSRSATSILPRGTDYQGSILDEECASLRSQLFEANRRLREKTEELDSFKEEKEKERTKMEKLENDRKFWRQTSEEMRDDLHQQREKLMGKAESVKQEHDKIQKRLDEKERRCQELEEKCRQLEQDKRNQEESMEKLKEELQQTANAKDARATKLEGECNSLRSSFSDILKTLKEKDERLITFVSEQETEKKKVQELEHEKKMWRQSSEEMQETFLKEKQRLQETAERFQQLLDCKINSCSELEERCEKLEKLEHVSREQEKRIAQLEEALRQAQIDQTSSLSLLQCKEDELEEMKKDYELACEGCRKKEHFQAKWEESIEENRKYVEDRKFERQSAKINIKERDEEILKLKSEMKSLQQTLADKDKELTETNESLTSIQLEKDMACVSFAEERTEKEKEMEDLREEITQLQKDLERVQISTPKSPPERFQTSTPTLSPNHRHTVKQEIKQRFSPLTPAVRTPPVIPEEKEEEENDACKGSGGLTDSKVQEKLNFSFELPAYTSMPAPVSAAQPTAATSHGAGLSLSSGANVHQEFSNDHPDFFIGPKLISAEDQVTADVKSKQEKKLEQRKRDHKLALLEQAKDLGLPVSNVEHMDEDGIYDLEKEVAKALERKREKEEQLMIDKIIAEQLRDEDQGRLPFFQPSTSHSHPYTQEHRHAHTPPQHVASEPSISGTELEQFQDSAQAMPRRSLPIERQQSDSGCPICSKPRDNFDTDELFRIHVSNHFEW